MWKGDCTQNKLEIIWSCPIAYFVWWVGIVQECARQPRGYSGEDLCSQGHSLKLFTSSGRYGWRTKMAPSLNWQKAEKVVIHPVIHSVVTHKVKNEAEGLISLDSQIKCIFLGLGCGKGIFNCPATVEGDSNWQLFIRIFKNQGLHEKWE